MRRGSGQSSVERGNGYAMWAPCVATQAGEFRKLVVVSKRIKEEFENGKDYYKLEGQVLQEPLEPWAKPSPENLEYHAYNVFR